MAKKFSELEAKMSPEARLRAKLKAEKILAEMEKPPSISTLRAQIEAMGGKLEIAARWPDGSIDTCDPSELALI